jgi:hypothetical protein
MVEKGEERIKVKEKVNEVKQEEIKEEPTENIINKY